MAVKYGAINHSIKIDAIQNKAIRIYLGVHRFTPYECLHETYYNQWKIESLNKPKLCTYLKFKPCFKIEDYVMSFMSRRQRSYLGGEIIVKISEWEP